MDCIPPGSSLHGIFLGRILELGAMPFGVLPDPGIEPESLVAPALAGGFFITEPPGNPIYIYIHTHTHTYINIYTQKPEKAMAPHSSTLAWKIPWMEEPGRLQSMGSLRVGHD